MALKYLTSMKSILNSGCFKVSLVIAFIVILLPSSIFSANTVDIFNNLYMVILLYLMGLFFMIGMKTNLNIQLVEKCIEINSAIIIITGLLINKLWLTTTKLPFIADILGIFITGINTDNISETALDFGLSVCGIYLLILTVGYCVLMHYFKNSIRKQIKEEQTFYVKLPILLYLVYFLNLIFVIITAFVSFILFTLFQSMPTMEAVSRIIIGLTGIISMQAILVLMFLGISIMLFNKNKLSNDLQ